MTVPEPEPISDYSCEQDQGLMRYEAKLPFTKKNTEHTCVRGSDASQTGPTRHISNIKTSFLEIIYYRMGWFMDEDVGLPRQREELFR